MTDLPSTDRNWLREVHAVSWLAGGLVAAALVVHGTPDVLCNYLHPGYDFDLTDAVRWSERAGMVISTVYLLEQIVRRARRRWQFSLRELLIAFTAACLFVAVVADHYRRYQRALAWVEEMGLDLYRYPPLFDGSWFWNVPLFAGLACLSVGLVNAALWAIRTIPGWLTRDWVKAEEPGAKNNDEEVDHESPRTRK